MTYLVADRDVHEDAIDASDDETPENMAIGGAAEEHVAAEEARTGRLVERMPHNNPGFDILSVGCEQGDLRYIEVKGLRGAWGVAGVPLSAQQFALAWRERERYWLYVVEFAQEEGQQRVTRVQDPVGKATQYRVDGGWRVLGVDADTGGGVTLSSSDTQAPRPDVGGGVTLADGRAGTILEITGAGELARLRIQFAAGEVENLLYRPDQMTLSQPREG